MADFLCSLFLDPYQEDNCCPVFLKVPMQIEGIEGLLMEKVLGWESGLALPLSGPQQPSCPLFFPCPPSPSTSLTMVATVVFCVLATLQAWPGLWASHLERARGSPGENTSIC